MVWNEIFIKNYVPACSNQSLNEWEHGQKYWIQHIYWTLNSLRIPSAVIENLYF